MQKSTKFKSFGCLKSLYLKFHFAYKYSLECINTTFLDLQSFEDRSPFLLIEIPHFIHLVTFTSNVKFLFPIFTKYIRI